MSLGVPTWNTSHTGCDAVRIWLTTPVAGRLTRACRQPMSMIAKTGKTGKTMAGMRRRRIARGRWERAGALRVYLFAECGSPCACRSQA